MGIISFDTYNRTRRRVKGHLSAAAACAVIAVMLLFLPALGSAQTACSKVSIEILQELTLERIAFDAKMVITNNVPDKNLTNVRVDVTIKDADGNVKNDLFFVRVSSMNNIASVDGSGTVGAASAAEIHWLIIPSPGAGGTDPLGKPYWVGATLTYTVSDKQEVVSVNPDRITVRPEAQLVLDYFMPFEVLGDNPFTPQVEAPVPFPLAVRVMNTGYGSANNLKIDSAQPKIVDNKQGLLVNFRLLGAAVNDSAVSPSLTVPIGTLPSKKAATAYWEMIATLSGTFVEFGATFSHASELGGELTSIIKETNAHYLTHRVKSNLPGRDGRLDFLADTDRDAGHLPDTLFESEIPGGSTNPEDAQSPVIVVPVVAAPPRPTSQAPRVDLTVQTGTGGWVYAKLPDPSQGLLTLLDVVRADGVHLDPNNFWISEGLDQNYQKIFTLHLFDYRADAGVTGTYTLVFTQPSEDLLPPSTTIRFDGPSTGTDPVFITPATSVIFTAQDNEGGSGVDSMMRKIVGQDDDFVPALPLTLSTAGPVSIEYYSIDRAGNEEAVKTVNLHVDSAAATITSFQAVPAVIAPHAPRGVAAVRALEFRVTATDDMNSLKATIDIARGRTFTESAVVRTIETVLTKNVEAKVPWDGKDNGGVLVPTGGYTARLRVTDGLDTTAISHTAVETAAVTVAEWFTGQPLDANTAAPQLHPKVSGTKAVWQDKRNGNWDIYLKDITGGGSTRVTNNSADQINPSISGNMIVWQDLKNGDWDIYGYDIANAQEFVVSNADGDQQLPVISGDWVAWQDNRAGNWDIYAYNLAMGEEIRITNHERDQMHPAISGGLFWEDYRHGLGEIYTHDLTATAGTEARYTVNIYNQTFPAAASNMIAWTDQRNDQRDVYFSSTPSAETRVTYGAGDHSQAALLDGVIAYTDYEAGYGDPNLAFFDTTTGVGAKLTADPARQEEPALGTDVLVWQDNRDGIEQIYWSDFRIEVLPISAELKPGFNLIAVGEKLAGAYPTAAAMILAHSGDLGMENIVTYNSLNGVYLDTSAGDEIALQKGMAIGVYAGTNGALDVAESAEQAMYTLLPGTNYIGVLAAPNGYTAYNLLASIGLDAVQSVRRFNNQTGLWETASVTTTAEGKEPVGVNFLVRQGEGLIVTMKTRVDGWKP